MSNQNQILLDLVCNIDYHAASAPLDLSWLHNVAVLVNSSGVAEPTVIECTDASQASAAGFAKASVLFANGATKVYVIQIDKARADDPDNPDLGTGPWKDLKKLAESGAFKNCQFFTLYIPQTTATDEELYNDSGDVAGDGYIKKYLGKSYYPGVVERTFKYVSGNNVTDHYPFASNFVSLSNWKCNIDFRDTPDDDPWLEAMAIRLKDEDWNNGQFIEVNTSAGLNDYNKAMDAFKAGYSTLVTDKTYGTRAWGAFVGKKSIVVPYAEKEFFMKIQEATYNFIQMYKPNYTVTNATRLGAEIRDKVVVNFVPKYFNYITMSVYAVNTGFRVKGQIDLPVIRAIWGADFEVYEYNE